MRPKLFANLVETLETWVGEHCEDDEWPDFFVGDEMALKMAEAARAVFEASVNSQKYAIDQDNLKPT